VSSYKFAALGLALLGLAAAEPATAAVTNLGVHTTFDLSAMNAGTFTLSTPGLTAAWEITGNDFKADFKNQNASTVLGGVATVFGITPGSLTTIGQIDSLTSSVSFTSSAPNYFNYVAIHNAQGEAIFYFANPILAFSGSATGSLSNMRAFSNGTTPGTGTHGSPVPEPSTWAMMALGFAGLAFFAARRKMQPAAAKLAVS